jgi:photosystem II stability/assembly factor-like uncharacterized protein
MKISAWGSPFLKFGWSTQESIKSFCTKENYRHIQFLLLMHTSWFRSALRLVALALLLCVSLVLALPPLHATDSQPASGPLAGLRWRMIGPFRGGRTIAVSGVEGQPNLFYIGAVGGGVWKSANAGETWEPIFDKQPIGSIGAIAVAPSDPEIIYVGTGEADFRSNLTYGIGVFKSTDAGKTWTHIGLKDSRHISRIAIDPQNPQRVLVAAMGSAYGPGPERGVFLSTDGGANWRKTLYKDPETGAIDVQIDRDNPQTVLASLVRDRRPPWSTYAPITGGGSIFKSTDGGATWNPITGGGLPSGEIGRIGLAVARGTGGKRIYALIDTKEDKDRGLYRSDDAGQTWQKVGSDPRISSRGWYFGEVDVDPKNPDIVYTPNVSIYRSTDGGKNFEAIKGAPGGDDYHALWIDPATPTRMIFGSDQGAGISLDNGATWSSWYNQPTAQFYHVVVDNQFPYHVYGAQQDSGSIDTTSRSNDGSITFRDWHPTAAGESGYIAPDPVDANIVYGGSTFGELFRYDKRTGQAQNIAPEAVRNFGADPAEVEFRFSWTSPLVFSPQDSHTLYYGSQNVLRSANQGNSWEKISPDLTGTDAKARHDGPDTAENAMQRGHGVVYTIAPSSLAAGQIWAGTDTGLIQLTRDNGKTWTNVTPQGLAVWSKISLLDAGHFAAGTAYAAIDRHRVNDITPYIYRTHDFGKTWTRINSGIPEGAYVRAVREDPVRQGLLFAGTELGIFFSLNDGDSWQPLQLNLPASPVHDLVIKGNDLVIATHGRSFWILDDISPLRQIKADITTQPTTLFKPADAIRMRANTNHDTPLSPEVPAGENPPTGAIFYYSLNTPAQGEVKIEILDSAGHVIRAYSSNDKPWSPPAPPAFASYWFGATERISTQSGMHRLVWDMHYQAPRLASMGANTEYSMSTVFGQNVGHEPEGAQALPGNYQVRLLADGKTYMQPFKLTMDPRVKVAALDLQKQFALETRLLEALQRGDQAVAEIRRLRSEKSVITAAIESSLAEIEPMGPAPRRPRSKTSLSAANAALLQLATAVASADAAPTSQQTAAAQKALGQNAALMKQWDGIKSKAQAAR